MPDIGSGAPRAHLNWPTLVGPNRASLQQSRIFHLTALRLITSGAIHAPPTPGGVPFSLTATIANLTVAIKSRFGLGHISL